MEPSNYSLVWTERSKETASAPFLRQTAQRSEAERRDKFLGWSFDFRSLAGLKSRPPAGNPPIRPRQIRRGGGRLSEPGRHATARTVQIALLPARRHVEPSRPKEIRRGGAPGMKRFPSLGRATPSQISRGPGITGDGQRSRPRRRRSTEIRTRAGENGACIRHSFDHS